MNRFYNLLLYFSFTFYFVFCVDSENKLSTTTVKSEVETVNSEVETIVTTEQYYDAKNYTSEKNEKIVDIFGNITIVETNEDADENITSLRMATPCSTPNGDVGFCIEIQNCTILWNQLTNTKAVEFLRTSRCGPSNENRRYPKVCCGRYGNYKHLLVRNPLPKRCGMQNVTLGNRIFGGENSQLGEFPWMARIIHKNQFGYKSPGCAAFLIHARYILTAAHCINSDSLRPLGPPFEVLLGEHNTDTDLDCNEEGTKCADMPQRIRIADVVVHPRYQQWSRHHHNDIALVHLRKGARFSDFVQPLCLLDHNYDDAYEYWLSGWGKTETAETSPIKLKTSVAAVTLQNCQSVYTTVRININRSQICAGGTHKDSCTGDSGGPLMVQRNATHWYAAGIVSFGMQCGREGWPGVYTNVPSFIPWVKREILNRAQQNQQRNHHANSNSNSNSNSTKI